MVDELMMTSSRPYLLRALNEWIMDNTMTPHIVVDASGDGVIVPLQFVENGKIVLNISPFAVRDLLLNDESILFSARFAGKSMNVVVPVANVLAIYAKENGQGMVFSDDLGNTPVPPNSPLDPDSSPIGEPKLKLVK